MAICGVSVGTFKIAKKLPALYPMNRRFNSTNLMQVLCQLIPKERERVAKFRKECGTFKTGETTIGMMYGGMRGINAMVWEPSSLHPEEGIRFRGLTIDECRKQLPGVECEPLPESIFWLLCTGKVPTKEQAKAISDEWAKRSKIPKHVVQMLNQFPKTLHPMAQLSCALTALSHDSKFAQAYANNAKKDIYWEFVYEDSMDLLAKITGIAALIYTNTYKAGKMFSCYDSTLDWSANFAKLMGYEKPEFIELMRLYLTIHCDHEGGNVSAHAAHLVNSALSDPFLSYAAGLNGLAGPLHGLANQEVLLWLLKLQKELGNEPTEEQLKEFITKTLKSGQVIPGYGHAVLRKTDPRFTCQAEFAQKNLPDDPLFKLVSNLYKVVPPILTSLGKVQNPWPNVDAHSGILLSHYGMTEMKYYTVLFGVSRAIGVCASLIWSRALGLPLERPKSMSTNDLIKLTTVDDKK